MRTIFVKANFGRAARYCMETRIVMDEHGKRVARKRALFPDALPHLRDMEKSSKELPEILNGLEICPCTMDGDEAVFPFIEGKTFYEYIVEQSKCGKDEGLEAWRQMLSLIEPSAEFSVPFTTSPEFEKAFGPGEVFEGERAYRCCALDLTPYNVIVKEGTERPVLIDYEWRVVVPVPIALIKYFAVRMTYDQFQEVRDLCPPIEEVLPLVEPAAPIGCYQQAVEHFVLEVWGDTEEKKPYFRIKEQYQKLTQNPVRQMLSAKERHIQYLQLQNRAMEEQWKRDASQWQEQAKEKDEYIAYLESKNRDMEGQWKADADQWQEQTKEKDEYIAHLESQNQAIKRQWMADVAQWQMDSAQWKSDAAQWEEQKSGYEERIGCLGTQAQTMEEQWKAEAAQRQKDNAQWQSEKAQWQDEADRLSDELSGQETARNRMMNSLSWRLTRPLRGVDGVVRRLFRKN